MAYLVFQLKAPLGSFGNNQGELRLSDTTPRKSMVLGLLSAALGITRDNVEAYRALSRQLRLAVATLSEPLPTFDFHTVQAPMLRTAASRAEQVRAIHAAIGGVDYYTPGKRIAKYNRTIVTRREYVQDGHWLIALQGEPAHLQTIKDALEFPVFTLYLGRKSCPLAAFTMPHLVPTGDALEAFKAWGAVTQTLLPDHLQVHLDAGVACPLTGAVTIRKADARTHTLYNHFAFRNITAGTTEITSHHVPDPTQAA